MRYWGKQGTTPRYLCSGDYQTAGRYCIGFSGTAADRRIENEVLSIISHEGVCASLQAIESLKGKHNDQQHQALEKQLQQLEYEAERAFLQYDEADPKNRLVAETLEQRWNDKLEKVEEIKNALCSAKIVSHALSEQDKERILDLGNYFGDTWKSSNCTITLKKKIIRYLIKEIIVDSDDDKKRLTFIVHWQGGDHTSFAIERPLPASKAHKTSEKDIDVIKKMAEKYSDTEIAKVLSKLDRRTGKGHRWTKASVGTARRKLGIRTCCVSPQGILNMAEAKRYCGVSDSALMRLIEANILPAVQVVPYAPYEIKKEDLDKDPVATIIKILKKTGRLVLEGSTPDNQKELFL